MTMKTMKKAIGGALLATGIGAMMLPASAHASTLGWNASCMVENASGGTGLKGVKFTPAGLSGWVQTFTQWILGIAIVLFVLKVVFTAIDRLLFANVTDPSKNTKGGSGTSDGILQRIPLIGAYPAELAWKEVWIHFGKNLAICAGAWILVQIVVGVVLFVFDAATGNVGSTSQDGVGSNVEFGKNVTNMGA